MYKTLSTSSHIRIVSNSEDLKCRQGAVTPVREEKKRMNDKKTAGGILPSPECLQVIWSYRVKGMQTFAGHSSGVPWLLYVTTLRKWRGPGVSTSDKVPKKTSGLFL